MELSDMKSAHYQKIGSSRLLTNAGSFLNLKFQIFNCPQKSRGTACRAPQRKKISRMILRPARNTSRDAPRQATAGFALSVSGEDP
jgi:hypothetical protein